MRFLLEVARASRPAPAPIPSDPPDWDEVLRLAEPHGMEPLLFRHLSQTGHDHVPPEIWNRIAAAQEENARRNLAATGELLAVLRDLGAAGIPVLTYKGPILAQHLYGDVAARRFGDLDIMVRPSHVRPAREVLRARGYVTETELPGWRFDAFVKIQKEIAFIHRDTLQEVDLQWTVTERTFALRWDLPALWRRAVTVEVAGSPVRTFSTDDLALVLCVHGTTHLWERLAWIADLGMLVASFEVDWPTVVDRARQIGAEQMVLASLAVAHRITGCGVPPPIEVPAAIRRLADQIASRVEAGAGPEAAHPEAPFHPVLARLRDSRHDRATYLSRLLFTPTRGDWESGALPSSLQRAYRVIRPIRLAAHYGRRLIRRRQQTGRGSPP